MNKTMPANSAQKTATIQIKSGERFTSGKFFDQDGAKASKRYTQKEHEILDSIKEEYGLEDDNIDFSFFTRCYKDDGTIYITAHAYERMKERNGWNTKTSERMVAKIYKSGKDIKELKGKTRLWAMKKAEKNGKDIRHIVYGDKLYIFYKTTMVTVFNIPSDNQIMRLLNSSKRGEKKVA